MSTDEEHIDEEQVDKKQLMELYEIALDESRHHDNAYTRMLTTSLISASVIGAFVGYFGKEYLLEIETEIENVKFYFASFGSIVAIVWFQYLCLLREMAYICRDVANTIEDILKGNKEMTPEIGNLFVAKKIKEVQGMCWVKPLFIKRQKALLIFLLVLLAAWWVVWLVVIK